MYCRSQRWLLHVDCSAIAFTEFSFEGSSYAYRESRKCCMHCCLLSPHILVSQRLFTTETLHSVKKPHHKLLLLLCLLCTCSDTARKDQEFRAASSVSTSSPDWYPSAKHIHHAVGLQTDCMVIVPSPMNEAASLPRVQGYVFIFCSVIYQIMLSIVLGNSRLSIGGGGGGGRPKHDWVMQ